MKAKVYLLLFFCIVFVTACSPNDVTSISPMTLLGSSDTGPDTVYYDPLTGAEISQTAYYWYETCDFLKVWVPRVCGVSVGIGIFLLLFIKKSQKVKRTAWFAFIIGIPITLIGIFYYGVSFLVDYLIVPMG